MDSTFKVSFSKNSNSFKPKLNKINNNINTKVYPSPKEQYDEVIYDGGELTLEENNE